MATKSQKRLTEREYRVWVKDDPGYTGVTITTKSHRAACRIYCEEYLDSEYGMKEAGGCVRLVVVSRGCKAREYEVTADVKYNVQSITDE